jgi:glycosyltransferase involved in cell wall biosynthesis
VTAAVGRTGAVHFLVPEHVDDPARVSGGNVYDLALGRGLSGLGWSVRMSRLAPGESSMSEVLAPLDDGSTVLIDGLLATLAPDALMREATRLRTVVIAHMVAPAIAAERERVAIADRQRRAFGAARMIVTTSRWTRDELLAEGMAQPDRVRVARPGVAAAPATAATEDGTRLLCVGAVAPHKGQDVLVRALAGLDDDPPWTCTFAGSLDVAPDFVAALESVVDSAGLRERIRFAGVLTRRALEDAYAAADLLVAPSRVESFGMAVAEALAHGIPVVASRVGGLPEAVAGGRAGILVAPQDPKALGAVLRRWRADAGIRSAWKAEALSARRHLPDWGETARCVAEVLCEVMAGRARWASGSRS